MESLICILLLVVTSLCPNVHAYSFEERLPLFKFGGPQSTFGYSVAMHRYLNGQLHSNRKRRRN